MKRHLKLVILLLVLGALVSAYFIYTASIKDSDNDGNEPTENTLINVLTMYSGEISSIKYTFEEKEVSLIKKENSWKWADDVDFPLNSVYPESMASALSDITALRLISEDSTKYVEYGLDNPSLEVSFDTVDGNKYVYTVGNRNTVTGGYYFKLNNSDKVYLSASGTTSVSPFAYGVYDMIQTEDFPAIKYENIKKLEYTSQNKKQTVTKDKGNAGFFADIYSYFLVDEKGNTLAADGKNVAELLVAIADLEFDKCESYKPDSALLEKLGLGDDRRIDFVVTYDEKYVDNTSSSNINVSNEKVYSFSLGFFEDEETKAKVYCVREKDSLIVYTVSDSAGEKLFAALNAELDSKYVCPVPSETVETFTLEKQGNVVASYSSEDLISDGKKMDLYNKVISLIFDGKSERTKGELFLKAMFKIGENTLELKVYEYDDNHYIADFDKFENMLVSAEKINAIVNAVAG